MRIRPPVPPYIFSANRAFFAACLLAVCVAGQAATSAARTGSPRAARWIHTLERARVPYAPRLVPASPNPFRAPVVDNDEGVWSHLGIPGLQGHVAVYDPVRDRMLVFGGEDNFRPSHEVWSLSMQDAHPWTRLAPGGAAPAPRAFATGIYDPARDRLIVYGGWVPGEEFDDVWALSLSGPPVWASLAPAGTPPSAFGRMIYDPVRDRALVYDGPQDIFALSLTGDPEWSHLIVDGGGLTDRSWPALAYDAQRDRLILFGGEDESWPMPADVWALELADEPAWKPVPANGTPPDGRIAASAVYDPAGDRVIFYGGSNLNDNLGDAWSLSFAGAATTWTPLNPTGATPFERSFHTAVYDSARERMVVFSGAHFVNGPPDPNDVWALDLDGPTSWSAVNGTAPSPRAKHAAIYDPDAHRMIIFGGYAWPYGDNNEFWACSLDEQPTWTELHPTGPLPPPLSGVPAIYDPLRGRMLIVGGADVWGLDLEGDPEVSHIAPGGTPPPGIRSAVYDAPRDRVIALATPDNAVWSLSLAGTPQWAPLHALSDEPVPGGTAAIYDPARDRVLIFGESDNEAVWALPLSGTPQWERLVPAGPAPPARHDETLIYDPARDRMVMLHGHDAPNDVWALSLAPDLEWRELTASGPVPFAEDGHSAIYDPEGDRMIVFGGQYFYNELNEAWSLAWGEPASHTHPARLANALEPCYPNPFNPRVTVPFVLQESGEASLTVYDVSGRRVATLFDEWTARGSHSAVWEGTSDAGERMSSGVYFFRLRARDFVATQKVVLLK